MVILYSYVSLSYPNYQRKGGRGFISGFSISGRIGEEINLFHFLFADDTLILNDVAKGKMGYLS